MEKRETVNILRVKIEGPKKDKNGKDFYSVGIQTKEYGDKWFNCHYFPFNPDKWEGTEQSLIFYEEDYQGKTYSKFKLPPRANGGLSEADRTSIALAVRQSSDAVTAVKKLRGELILSGARKETTSDGNEMPDFGPDEKYRTPGGLEPPKKEVDAELSSLEQSAEAARR